MALPILEDAGLNEDGGGGGGGGFPRLDQVLDPGADKVFAMGGFVLALKALLAATSDLMQFQDSGGIPRTTIDYLGRVIVNVDVGSLYAIVAANYDNFPTISAQNNGGEIGPADRASGIEATSNFGKGTATDQTCGGVYGHASSTAAGVLGQSGAGPSGFFQAIFYGAGASNPVCTLITKQQQTATADLFQAMKSDGTILAKITSTGRPSFTLADFANNAAAVGGGLIAGDLYMVTASDPRQVAVVV